MRALTVALIAVIAAIVLTVLTSAALTRAGCPSSGLYDLAFYCLYLIGAAYVTGSMVTCRAGKAER